MPKNTLASSLHAQSRSRTECKTEAGRLLIPAAQIKKPSELYCLEGSILRQLKKGENRYNHSQQHDI